MPCSGALGFPGSSRKTLQLASDRVSRAREEGHGRERGASAGQAGPIRRFRARAARATHRRVMCMRSFRMLSHRSRRNTRSSPRFRNRFGTRLAVFPLTLLYVLGCAGTLEQHEVVEYRGQSIEIAALPDSAEEGMSWVVKAFAGGPRDTWVRGFILADETNCSRLGSSTDRVKVEGHRAPWCQVCFDWTGLHIISHEGYGVVPDTVAARLRRLESRRRGS